MTVNATSSCLFVPCDFLKIVSSISHQQDNRENKEVGHSPCCEQNLIWSNTLKSPETTHLCIFTQNMFGCSHIFLLTILLSYMTCEGDSLHSKKGLCGPTAVCLAVRSQTGVCDYQTDHSASAICVHALGYSRADQMSLLHKWHHLHIFSRTELRWHHSTSHHTWQSL